MNFSCPMFISIFERLMPFQGGKMFMPIWQSSNSCRSVMLSFVNSSYVFVSSTLWIVLVISCLLYCCAGGNTVILCTSSQRSFHIFRQLFYIIFSFGLLVTCPAIHHSVFLRLLRPKRTTFSN